jgi:hypothetical protein
MPVGTYLYLHAVGGGNPIAVPILAQQGAERGTDRCDRRDHHLSGSHVRRVLKSIISVHKHRNPPLGQSDMLSHRLNAHRYSPVLTETTYAEFFFGEEGYGRIGGGTRVLELAADIWEAALGHSAR